MSDINLELWKRIYDSIDKLERFTITKHALDEVQFIHYTKDKKAVYYLIGNVYEDKCGIMCYFTEQDYMWAANHADYLNEACPSSRLYLYNGMAVLWSDRTEICEKNIDVLKALKKKYRKNATPEVLSLKARYVPEFPGKRGAEKLAKALESLVEMVDKFSSLDNQDELGGSVAFVRKTRKDRDEYSLTRILLPEKLNMVLEDNPALEILRKMPPKKSLAIDEVLLPVPTENPKKKCVFFPTMVVITDEKSKKPLFLNFLQPNYIDTVYSAICDIANEYGKPASIKVFNPITEEYIDAFCEKAGIKLLKGRKTPAYIEDMFAYAMDCIMDNMSGKFEDDADEEESGGSYVISVSLGAGCYRHIRISAGATLYDLHEAIQDAFGFDDDHLHAFFMDNRAWSDNSYSNDDMSGGTTTDMVRLSKVLSKGQKFLYIFDFGDEWRFQCKVLRLNDEPCEISEIIRCVGEAPEQYPDYDEDE